MTPSSRFKFSPALHNYISQNVEKYNDKTLQKESEGMEKLGIISVCGSGTGSHHCFKERSSLLWTVDYVTLFPVPVLQR